MPKNKQRSVYRKKKRFQGNRYTKLRDSSVNEQVTANNESTLENSLDSEASTSCPTNIFTESLEYKATVSYSKVVEMTTSTPSKRDKQICGYRLMDVEILSNVFADMLCPGCSQMSLKLSEVFSKKNRLASTLALCCVCDEIM